MAAEGQRHVSDMQLVLAQEHAAEARSQMVEWIDTIGGKVSQGETWRCTRMHVMRLAEKPMLAFTLRYALNPAF